MSAISLTTDISQRMSEVYFWPGANFLFKIMWKHRFDRLWWSYRRSICPALCYKIGIVRPGSSSRSCRWLVCFRVDLYLGPKYSTEDNNRWWRLTWAINLTSAPRSLKINCEETVTYALCFALIRRNRDTHFALQWNPMILGYLEFSYDFPWNVYIKWDAMQGD